nr:hypothetical protein [Tanacetum cinerariifolium]
MKSKLKLWASSSSTMADTLQVMNPYSKNKVVSFPRFTKLIIHHTLAKFPYLPRRSNEPHHIFEDDRVVGFTLASANVEAKGIRIPDDLLTEEIRGQRHISYMMMILIVTMKNCFKDTCRHMLLLSSHLYAALNVKFKKSLISTDSCKHIILRKWDNDDHPGGLPKGDKNAKKQKTTRSIKSVKGVSSSKQSIHGFEAPSLTQWQDFDTGYEVQEVDDEEVVLEEATKKVLVELEL